MQTASLRKVGTEQRPQITRVLDPLALDTDQDRVIVTTERRMARVALVAAEAGARFQRESLAQDAMAWLMSPRRLFDGARPIDACVERDDCLRAIIVHGLGLALDAERGVVDALIDQGGGDGESYESGGMDDAYGTERDDQDGRADHARDRRTARLRLYSATIVDSRDNVMIQAFHASTARNVREVRSRLVGRYGVDLADVADIRLGIPVASPVVVALVSPAVVELIRESERNWSSPDARTFGVDIQQCIQR